MNTRKWVCALIVGTSCWAGCSGDESEAGSSPQQRCEEFVETVCVGRAECQPPSYRAEEYDTCQFAFALELDCSEYSADRDASACFSALERGSCEQRLQGLPFSCGEAFFQ